MRVVITHCTHTYMYMHTLPKGLPYIQHVDGRPHQNSDAEGCGSGDAGQESAGSGPRERRHSSGWTQRHGGELLFLTVYL